ncbi:hypothetical protein B0H63DRAFT_528159 [Podospora didyma]|uniref:Peptidase C14 caspase domain-containing protein n=1 Tax=Podospora didyma TaxID=330526 RepID=A0AAE0N509_9PEZI|nr:hypothetical protein B0H63DRAFT_528159 [Podospora didyma]
MLPSAALGQRHGQAEETPLRKIVDALTEEATRASRAPSHASRYETVQVLLISWEHDDLGVAPEVDALATVFDRDFGFGVAQIIIPVEKSLFQLTHALLDWVESYGSDGSLLIVYYAGHGLVSESGRTLIWTNRRCSEDLSYRELKWNGCEDILLQSAADKLFIFDCCYAANAVSTGGCGVSEVICASGFKPIAPLPGILHHLKALDPSRIMPDRFRIANALAYSMLCLDCNAQSSGEHPSTLCAKTHATATTISAYSSSFHRGRRQTAFSSYTRNLRHESKWQRHASKHSL